MDTRIGAELAGYRIESVIGRGGMGVVYLAEHLRLKRKVALKVLAPELAADERFRDRFIHESEIAASLDHPNVVTIHDAGEADGLLYLAMRYVGGRDLKTLIAHEGALEPERAVALLTQVAGALDAAHARGLIHRDVKSANVLIEPGAGSLGEHAYLTDFGLTKRPESVSGLTKTGQFLGSVEYAAPEQFEGSPLTPQTDVYSLACVAYECLTGEVPYPRDNEAAIMHAHLREAPPKPTTRRPDLPPAVDDVIARGMAKRPEQRLHTPDDLARGLAGSVTKASAEGDTPPGRRRRIVIAGLAVGAMAIGVTLALLLRSGSPNGAPPPPPSTGAVAAPTGVVKIDPATNRASIIRFSLNPTSSPLEGRAIVAGAGFVWVQDALNGQIYKVDPRALSVVGRVPLTGYPASLAIKGDVVWAGLSTIDARTNEVTARRTQGVATANAVFAGRWLWALFSGSLERFDPSTAKPQQSVDVAGTDLSAGGGTVWVLSRVRNEVIPVSSTTGRVGPPIALSGDPIALAVGGGAIWIADRGGSIQGIPITGGGGIETVHLGGSPADVAFGAGSVWVANCGNRTIARIDPLTARVLKVIRLSNYPIHITVGEDGVWANLEPRPLAGCP